MTRRAAILALRATPCAHPLKAVVVSERGCESSLERQIKTLAGLSSAFSIRSSVIMSLRLLSAGGGTQPTIGWLHSDPLRIAFRALMLMLQLCRSPSGLAKTARPRLFGLSGAGCAVRPEGQIEPVKSMRLRFAGYLPLRSAGAEGMRLA